MGTLVSGIFSQMLLPFLNKGSAVEDIRSQADGGLGVSKKKKKKTPQF